MLRKLVFALLFVMSAGLFYAEQDLPAASFPGLNTQILAFNPAFSVDLQSCFGQDKGIYEATTKKSTTPIQKKPTPANNGGGPSILNICGYVLIAAGVGGLGAGYYFDTQAAANLKDAQKNYDDYKNATSGFDDKWSAYQDKLNQARLNIQYRNYSYIGGGVALGAGLILAFIPSGPKKKYSIYVTPDSIYAVYRF